MNTENEEDRSAVSVAEFLEAGGETLGLEVVGEGKGQKKSIQEAAINRPGLGLSGFFDHFSNKRIQCIGLAEHTYLSSLSDEERETRLREVFKQDIPCVVVTRGQDMFSGLSALADEYEVTVLSTKMVTMHFINAATILMENLMSPRMKVQGTMIEIMGIGVLLEGKSGMGKSETALALIRKGATLVSDDITALRLDSAGSVIASTINVTRFHMEVRGLGIIHVPSLFGVASVREEKRLDLIATLCEPSSDEDRTGRADSKLQREIFGVIIPQVTIPVAPGRDLANVVEVAALDHKLRRLGHDATKEMDERLMELMDGGRAASE